MPMVIGFRGGNPRAPAEINPLYSGTVTKDGKWDKPPQTSTIYIKGAHDGWSFAFIAPNKYVVTHNLGTRDYSVQIAAYYGAHTNVLELGENSFTVETFNKDDYGVPEPQSFQYQLRQHHL